MGGSATPRREEVCLGGGLDGTDGTRRGERPTDPRPLVIVNPVAGSGQAGRFWRRCADACASLALDVVETTGPGDATALAETAGDRLVIAVGGDGTAHEVVNGLLRRHNTQPPRVGFLQRGTGADLRRSLPAPRRPQDVPSWLTRDRWRPIDAGLLTTSSDRRFFINVADVGIGAEVVRRADRGPRWAGGTVNFLSAAIVSLMVHRNAPIRIRLDDGPWLTRRIRTVAIANGAYLGGAMFMAPRARVDDGLFEVITVGDISRLKGIFSLPLLYRGTHEQLAEVEFAQAGRVQIESDQAIGIEADGELAGSTPVTFRILPKALQVIAWPPLGILSADAKRG